MRVLVGWTASFEAETIGLVLDIDENVAHVITDAAGFLEAAASPDWDVVIMSLSFPSSDESLQVFQRIRAISPSIPIIGAWRPEEIVDLARFISGGLHSHLMRDDEGNFIFLLATMAEAAYTSVQAQRARMLAERLREELDSVRRLQESVIPHDMPKPRGYRIAARYEPAQIRVLGNAPVTMAGGDYYDVFELDDHSMVLLVGDASGHGVKACMSIMTMHTLIRMIRSQQYRLTSEFVADVNRRLCASDIVQDGGGFITLLYSSLDIKQNRLQWTSAGAPMPLLQNLETNEVIQLGEEEDGGLPLAIEEEWQYEQCSVDIPDNSRLLIYTDGLDEAFPADRQGEAQFGTSGIVASLKSSIDLPVEQALARLFDDSNAFTEGSGRTDDTSIVLLERKAT